MTYAASMQKKAATHLPKKHAYAKIRQKSYAVLYTTRVVQEGTSIVKTEVQ
jgi:hypothetical protein